MNYLGPLLFPLVAAFTYVAAVMSLKRSTELGAGLWHTTLVSNVFPGLAFQTLLIFGGTWQPLELWWQPLLVAVLFLLGQVLTLCSLQWGDVSIATPVLGLKILLVAVFTVLITREPLSWQLWTAAALSTAGIVCLNHTRAHRPGASAALTLATAAGGALSFALFDVLVQKWSPVWGIGRFLPLTIGSVGLLTLVAAPLIPRPAKPLSSSARSWLLCGGVLIAIQSILFVCSVAYYAQATASNVVYSSRGVWSVVAVALLGKWFNTAEQHLGGAILRWRFVGAALMFAAIVLVLVK